MRAPILPIASDAVPSNGIVNPPPVVNRSVVDAFTFAHFGIGALMGFVGCRWSTTLAIAATWEILERPLKKHLGHVFPNPSQDSDGNMIADVVAWMAGWGALQWRGRAA